MSQETTAGIFTSYLAGKFRKNINRFVRLVSVRFVSLRCVLFLLLFSFHVCNSVLSRGPCDLCATLAQRSLLNYVKVPLLFPLMSLSRSVAQSLSLSSALVVRCLDLYVRQVRVLSLSFCALFAILVAVPFVSVVFFAACNRL